MSDRLTDEKIQELDEMERAARKRIAELERDRDKWEAAFGDAEDMVFEARRERDHYRIACGDADDEVREARKRIAELEAILSGSLSASQREEARLTSVVESERDGRFDLGSEVAVLRAKIAELEAQNDASQQIIEHRLQTMIEMREAIDAREAQLAEMRREIEGVGQYELCATGRMFVPRRKVLEIIDRYAIPTTPPEAEVDPREDEE